MIPAISTALDAIVGNVLALSQANGAGRAYELYIMTGIAEELKRRRAAVWIQRSDGSPILSTDHDRRFIQRGGAPTGVFSAVDGPDNASSIVFKLAGSSREWEIWNGIQFKGRSGGTHEIDIALVPRGVGIALRAQAGGGTPGGRPVVSIECKDVGTKGDADEMRAFIARLYDLTLLNWHAGKMPHLPYPLVRIYPGAPSGNGPYQSFWQGNRSTYNIVARRTSFRPGAIAMTGYYAVQPRGPVTVGSAEDIALVQDVCDWIEQNLA